MNDKIVSKDDCFFHPKREIIWEKSTLEYIVKSLKVCGQCREIIQRQYGVGNKPMREPGEEG